MKHRKSPRASWYDYRSAGGYFITICTQNRQHYFGEIIDNNDDRDAYMRPNMLGKYAQQCRNQIPIFHPYANTHHFVCMPNHIHGIIVIDGSTTIDTRTEVSVATLQQKSLGQIVRGFKTGITKYAKQNNIPFQRQGRYHDRIIRNENEYNRISHYITENPSKRSEDKFYQDL